MYPYRPRRRWLRWILAYLAGTVAVMVIGLVIEAAVDPSPPGYTPFTGALPWASPSASLSQPVRHPVRVAPAGSASLSGPLTLVAGREVINGVELGFPHSTAGAVSAAAEVTGEVFSTLDPDRAAAVMRLTADPFSYADAPQQAAHGAVSDRQALGLPASGPVPDGYSLVVQPQEYQVRDVTAGSALVLLLSDLTMTQPGQGTQTRIGVFPFPVRWDAGDWKIAAPGDSSYLKLAAEPFSSQAATLGWQELLPQEAPSAG
jgi:hypothetical protein